MGTGAIVATVTGGIIDSTDLRQAGGVDPLLDAEAALAAPLATTPPLVELRACERAVNTAGAQFLGCSPFDALKNGSLGGIILGVTAGERKGALKGCVPGAVRLRREGGRRSGEIDNLGPEEAGIRDVDHDIMAKEPPADASEVGPPEGDDNCSHKHKVDVGCDSSG